MESIRGRVSIMTLDGGARFVMQQEDDNTGDAPIPVNVDKPVADDNLMTAHRHSNGDVRIQGKYGDHTIDGIVSAGDIYVSEDGGQVKVVHSSPDQKIFY